MKGPARLLQRAASPRSFALWLLAYALYFPLFFYGDVPFGLKRIAPYAKEGGILDTEFFYTAAEAYARLEQFGAEGRRVYHAILMGDLFYPVLLGGVLAVALTLLFRALRLRGRFWPYAGLVPLAMTVCDYTENLLVLTLLRHYPEPLTAAATAAGFATAAKFLFGGASFALLGLGLLLWLLRIRKN